MKTFVVLALCVTAALAALFDANLEAEWQSYKTTHNKAYAAQEEGVRRLIWQLNVRHIQKHNLAADMGKHTYWLGVNKYTDMTNEEFRRIMNGPTFDATAVPKGSNVFVPPKNVKLPDTVDWRTQNYVTPVKDQGSCSASWAFSATGALEGQHVRQTGTLTSLSEQNLIDCSRTQGNMGCEGGGLMDQCFTYVATNKGIDTEVSYPYTAMDGTCKYNPATSGGSADGFIDITSKDESELQLAVANIGPVSAAIDSTGSDFQHYSQGIYNNATCSQTQVNLGVLVIGYGTQNNQDYWLVKNSWGVSWGTQGYIMMSRNKYNQCGIATAASFPRVFCESGNCESNKQ